MSDNFPRNRTLTGKAMIRHSGESNRGFVDDAFMYIVYVPRTIGRNIRIFPSYARVQKLFREFLRNCGRTLGNSQATFDFKDGIVILPLMFSSLFA